MSTCFVFTSYARMWAYEWNKTFIYSSISVCVSGQLFLMNTVSLEHTKTTTSDCRVTWQQPQLPVSRGFIQTNRCQDLPTSMPMVRSISDRVGFSTYTTIMLATTVWRYRTYGLETPEYIVVMTNCSSAFCKRTPFLSVVSTPINYNALLFVKIGYPFINLVNQLTKLIDFAIV